MATQSFNPNLDPKRVFESAIGELHAGETQRSRANQPIYRRNTVKATPMHPDQAVATAAEALAALWKTSRAKQIIKPGRLSADGRQSQ
jgi:hypothetical protein